MGAAKDSGWNFSLHSSLLRVCTASGTLVAGFFFILGRSVLSPCNGLSSSKHSCRPLHPGTAASAHSSLAQSHVRLLSCWMFPGRHVYLWLLKPGVHDGEAVHSTELKELLPSFIARPDSVSPLHQHPHVIDSISPPHPSIEVSQHNQDVICWHAIQCIIRELGHSRRGLGCRGIRGHHRHVDVSHLQVTH